MFIFNELELFELDGLTNQTDLKFVEHSVHRMFTINSVDLNKAVDRVDDSIQDGVFDVHFQ